MLSILATAMTLDTGCMRFIAIYFFIVLLCFWAYMLLHQLGSGATPRL